MALPRNLLKSLVPTTPRVALTRGANTPPAPLLAIMTTEVLFATLQLCLAGGRNGVSALCDGKLCTGRLCCAVEILFMIRTAMLLEPRTLAPPVCNNASLCVWLKCAKLALPQRHTLIASL